jgi:hypothetical protein
MLRRHSKLVAWTLSIGFHVALAALLFQDETGSVRTLPHPVENLTRDDASEDDSAFTFAIAAKSEPAASPTIAISPPTGQRPIVPARPPTEIQNLIREIGARPAARVEVQDVSPIDFREPVTEPKPAGMVTEPMPMQVPAKPGLGKGQPLHGALEAGKSVVYILDRSTSMGLTRETFDAARASTLASVAALPDDAKFQVIAYNGTAVRLLPGQGLLKKTERHSDILNEALLELKPEGDSHHDRALRAALPLGADFLVFITDAGEDELASLRPILKGHGKPVSIAIVRVADGKVSAPAAFR